MKKQKSKNKYKNFLNKANKNVSSAFKIKKSKKK